MDIGAVRAALADKLAGIEAEVNAYARPNPTPPGVQILPPSVEYDYTSSYDLWTFTVQLFVSYSEDVSAQMLLDELCAPSGIKALLEADKTLNATVDAVRVERQSAAVQVQSQQGQPMLAVEFSVQVYARR